MIILTLTVIVLVDVLVRRLGRRVLGDVLGSYLPGRSSSELERELVDATKAPALPAAVGAPTPSK